MFTPTTVNGAENVEEQRGKDEILIKVPRSLLYQSRDKKSFDTFFEAEVNSSSQLLAYVNAGHPPPLVWSGGAIRSLAKGTVPLGVCTILPQLEMHTESFPPGSLLISYTDGLTEQTNLHGKQFGEERLRDHVQANISLGAQSLTQKLLDEIRNFAGNKDFADDVSLAIVRYCAESST